MGRLSLEHCITQSYFLTATVLLPFGFAAGDELFVPSNYLTSRPVSLSFQFYGVEQDTIYVRNEKYLVTVVLLHHWHNYYVL